MVFLFLKKKSNCVLNDAKVSITETQFEAVSLSNTFSSLKAGDSELCTLDHLHTVRTNSLAGYVAYSAILVVVEMGRERDSENPLPCKIV